MKVRPLHDRIIVQRIEEGEQKIGGIIIPDSAKEKPQQGKVIAVGQGKVKDDGKRQPLDVKEDDTILFGKYSGQEIKIDGEDYLIMGNLGIPELLIILAIIILIFGANRLPEIGRGIGRGIRNFKDATKEGAGPEKS